MRIYDPRLGRFLSQDPLMQKYAMLTPYQFASNSPISGIDLDGLEYYFAADGSSLGQGRNKNSTEVRIATSYRLIENAEKTSSSYVIESFKSIDLTLKQFLDRGHMVYGEGGANGISIDGTNPAKYFAWAFENFKAGGPQNDGKKPFSEETAKNKTWQDDSHSYKDGTIQTAGRKNSAYNLFNDARTKFESGTDANALDNLPGAKNVMAAVIHVILKDEKDPTHGGYQWIGGKGTSDDNDTWTNKVSNRVGTVKINTSSKYYTSFTVFYRFKKKDEK